MSFELILPALVLLAVAAIAHGRRQLLEAQQGEAVAGLSFANALEELRAPLQADTGAAGDANLRAFLLMIRTAEGTAGPNGYRTMFGHRLFEGYDDHPRSPMQFKDKTGQWKWTSAAGAYQFMAVSPIPTGGSTRVDTWDRLKRKLGLQDFTPASQDRAAVELIDEAGALLDVRAGRFAEAVDKVRKTWASMPGAGYNQPEKALQALQVAYVNAGGTLA